MEYNRNRGRLMMRKYLSKDGFQRKLEHSEGVGEFAFKVSQRIKQRNPDFTFDPEFVGFLGYVHDIGYVVGPEKHELHTINILRCREQIPFEIARMAMHGQLVEQYGEKEGNPEKYLPIGLEGVILTYVDMSIKTREPITVRARAKAIIKGLQGVTSIPDSLKQDIIEGMRKALPRFIQYERMVLALAGVNSVKDF